MTKKLSILIMTMVITSISSIGVVLAQPYSIAETTVQTTHNISRLKTMGIKLKKTAAKEKNTKLKKDGKLIDSPVYIVTFKGITKYGHASFINQKLIVHHEYNHVIDANSGESLYGFSYR